MSKDDTLHTNWYFATPIYYMHKGEWLKDLIKLTDPYIQIAKKNIKIGGNILNTSAYGKMVPIYDGKTGEIIKLKVVQKNILLIKH